MKKLILLLITLMLLTLNTHAKNSTHDFNKIIKDFSHNKSSVAISIKKADSGDIVYSLNDKIFMNPASVQKVLTMPAAVDKLGIDYKFITSIYSRGNDSYIIKLSGDPYLKTSDLKNFAKAVKPDTQNIYIDDSVLDNNTWGEGWQWDDDMNPLMPRFGAYNLDKNLVKITIIPDSNGHSAIISNPSKYPYVFNNNIKTSNVTRLDVKRDTAVSANIINLTGTVARPTSVLIPTLNIKRYFQFELSKALESNNIYIKNPYTNSKYKSSDKFIASVEHPLEFALNDILKNSNNMSAETVFKLAGNGTAQGGISVFNDYCRKIGVDTTGIRITDGSGVSQNNLVTSDFITEFLVKSKNSKVISYLPSPGEGTLIQRLLPIKESLSAKTGTLSGVSAIAGYLTAKSGKKYVFCIIQNDVNISDADKKLLEDNILRAAYLKL